MPSVNVNSLMLSLKAHSGPLDATRLHQPMFAQERGLLTTWEAPRVGDSGPPVGSMLPLH